MVRTSRRRAMLDGILDDIVHTYERRAAMSESDNESTGDSESTTDGLDSLPDINDSGHSSSTSSEDSNGEEIDDLISVYQQVASERYSVDRAKRKRRSEKLIDMLLYWEHRDYDRFRGFARIKPQAFRDLAERFRDTEAFRSRDGDLRPWYWVAERAAVAFYRIGRYGNAGGVRDVAVNCGCSEGSVINWTRITAAALNELKDEIITFATEDERKAAAMWVAEKSGCEEWGKGFAAVDGTHINLAWRPARHQRDYFNYKHSHSLNVAVVVLPHSLRIIEAIVGFPGSAQDSRVWAHSKILKKPRLYLDEDEFIWTDGGYGLSPFTVGPLTHRSAAHSRDITRFNARLSRVRVRVEHAIGYLKNRWQCLKGYRGNLYREQDHTTSSMVVVASIVAHTFASRYDKPEDIADYLLMEDFGSSEVEEIQNDLDRFRVSQAPFIRARQQAQREYAERTETEKATMSRTAWENIRKSRSLDRREDVFKALFDTMEWPEVDTSAESRRLERTVDEHERRRASQSQSNRARSILSTSQMTTSSAPLVPRRRPHSEVNH